MVAFSISAGTILKDNVPFIIKGINILGLLYDYPKDYSKDNEVDMIVDMWKFNAVRVPFKLRKAGQPYNGFLQFDKLVNDFTSRGVVVIFDAHDPNGQDSGAYYSPTSSPSLTDLSNFYRQLVPRYRNNPYVWFNLQNEPGGTPIDNTNYLNTHQTLIKLIRTELNATNMIVVDGSAWGQDVGAYGNSGLVDKTKSAILTHGPQIRYFEYKKYFNVIFSVHCYDQWAWGDIYIRLKDFLTRTKTLGLTLIVGEYGVENNGYALTDVPANVLNVCKELSIGHMAWCWDGNGANCLINSNPGYGFLMNKKDGTKPTNLSSMGNLIWDNTHS